MPFRVEYSLITTDSYRDFATREEADAFAEKMRNLHDHNWRHVKVIHTGAAQFPQELIRYAIREPYAALDSNVYTIEHRFNVKIGVAEPFIAWLHTDLCEIPEIVKAKQQLKLQEQFEKELKAFTERYLNDHQLHLTLIQQSLDNQQDNLNK